MLLHGFALAKHESNKHNFFNDKKYPEFWRGFILSKQDQT